MPQLTLFIGILSTLTGLVATALAIAHQKSFVTPLIPVAIGLLLCACGWIAGTRENARKHAMHAAVLLALIGFGGGFPGAVALVKHFSGTTAPSFSAALLRTIFSLLMFAQIFFSVRSFIHARRNRGIPGN